MSLGGMTLTQMYVVSGGIRTLWEGCALEFKWDHETHAAVSDFWPRLFELTSLLLSRGPIFLCDKNIPPAFCPLPSPVKVGPRLPTSLLWGASPFQMRLSFFSPRFFSGGMSFLIFVAPLPLMSFHCRSSLLLDEEPGKRRRASKCFFGQMVFISSWFLFLHSGATPSPRRCWSICSGVWGAGTEKLNYARKWRTRMLQNQYEGIKREGMSPIGFMQRQVLANGDYQTFPS